MTHTQSVESLFIAAEPGRDYEALTNWEKRGQWRTGIQLKWEGDSRAFIGQEVQFKIKGVPSYTFSYRITGLEPGRRVYMEYTGYPLKGRSAVEITPRTGGCEVAFHWMKVEAVGFFPRFYFALGLGLQAHRRRTRETLRMLKEYLEGRDGLL